jgi:hypothetical protein
MLTYAGLTFLDLLDSFCRRRTFRGRFFVSNGLLIEEIEKPEWA